MVPTLVTSYHFSSLASGPGTGSDEHPGCAAESRNSNIPNSFILRRRRGFESGRQVLESVLVGTEIRLAVTRCNLSVDPVLSPLRSRLRNGICQRRIVDGGPDDVRRIHHGPRDLSVYRGDGVTG